MKLYPFQIISTTKKYKTASKFMYAYFVIHECKQVTSNRTSSSRHPLKISKLYKHSVAPSRLLRQSPIYVTRLGRITFIWEFLL